MHPKFPHLFDPITIRGKVYKKRLIAAPTMFAHSIFTIPPMKKNVYRMVENRAKGGFAAASGASAAIPASVSIPPTRSSTPQVSVPMLPQWRN